MNYTKNIKKMSWMALSALSIVIMIATAATLMAPKTAEAEIGSSPNGNDDLAYWGGDPSTVSWYLQVYNRKTGQNEPAYCIQFGIDPLRGQDMSQALTAEATKALADPRMDRFIKAAYPADVMGYGAQSGLSAKEQWRTNMFLSHVVENQIAYKQEGSTQTMTRSRFIQLAQNEPVAVRNYAMKLLNFMENGTLPNSAVKIDYLGGESYYNGSARRLETGVYRVNDVESRNIQVEGIPAGFYMVGAYNGVRLDHLEKGWDFRLATDNIRYTGTTPTLTARAGDLKYYAPIIWEAVGANVQDVVQAVSIDPIPSAPFTGTFKAAVGKVEFKKINERTKAPLEGVRFNLLETNGTVVATDVSRADGMVKFQDIFLGDYFVQEVPRTADGFVDKSDRIPVSITTTDTIHTINSGTYVNTETENNFDKTDLKNGSRLKGSTLQIKDANGKVVREWVSDGTDAYVTRGLIKGNYTLHEVAAPLRYQLTEDIPFEVKENGEKPTVTMKDDRTRLIVKKIDKDSKKVIAGAKFALIAEGSQEPTSMLNPQGELVPAIGISDANGIVVFEGVEASDKSYALREYQSPEGYHREIDIPVKIVQTNDVNVVFENEETETVINKLDSSTKKHVAGAELQIIDSAGKVVTEWTSNGTPHTVKKLAKGNYILREKKAPGAYRLAKDVPFTVNTERVDTSVTMFDDRTKTVVKKVDAETKAPLAGAKFGLYEKDTPTRLAKMLDAAGNSVDAIGVTDAKGEIIFEGVSNVEKYILREIEAPKGYSIGADKEVIVDSTKEQVVEYTNKPTETVISKTDMTNGKPLKGATLQIKDSTGKVLHQWLTDETGTKTIKGLEKGKYTLHEESAPGPYRFAQSVPFEVKDDGTITKVTMQDERTRAVYVKKDSKTKEVLKGAKYTLLSVKDKKQVKMLNLQGTEVDATAVSNEKGEIVFEGVPAGEYLLVELEAPTGYSKAEAIKVVIDQKQVATSDVTDNQTETHFDKKDVTSGKPVEGAKLQVIDKDKKVVAEWITDKTGHHVINKLPKGEYTLKETMPPGRYQFAQEVKFEVKDDGSITKVVMHDERTRLTVYKKDGKDQKVLAGAKFGIYNNDGTVAKMLNPAGEEIDAIGVSDKDGKVEFIGLTAGQYVLKELEAPKGYMLNSDQEVTILQTENTKRDFFNYEVPKNVILPKTGN